jgi:hypothetical protein
MTETPTVITLSHSDQPCSLQLFAAAADGLAEAVRVFTDGVALDVLDLFSGDAMFSP